MTPARVILIILLATLAATTLTAQSADSGAVLAQARSLLESDRPIEAMQILRPLTTGSQPNAEATLLLSTGHFMIGEMLKGRAALDRAIEIDSGLRQAWLNRAALDMSEGRYDEAVEALYEARELDPSAPDNEINLGAAMVLKGEIGEASRFFNQHLSRNRSDANAYYLVASNYALGQQWELAIQHLDAAIRLNEKSRRRARMDPNFGAIRDYQPFQALLATDSYVPSPGSHLRAVRFEEPYDGGSGKLLTAVLNVFQLGGNEFDRDVEVTDRWALVWSKIRIKISNAPDGGGLVELSAPANGFSAESWQQRSDELIRKIREELAVLNLRRQ